MQAKDIKEILIKTLMFNKIYVQKNEKHFYIIAISKNFNKLNSVQKQQMVYTPLVEYISDNRIHALSIKTYTLEEWKKYKSKFKNFKKTNK